MSTKEHSITELPSGCVVGNKTVDTVLFEFEILYSGWECDGKAWVVGFTDGSKGLVRTDHTTLYIAKPLSIQADIERYEQILSDCEMALALLSEG